MNNAINEIKNMLEGTNSRIMEEEDRISEVENIMVEINETEREKENGCCLRPGHRPTLRSADSGLTFPNKAPFGKLDSLRSWLEEGRLLQDDHRELGDCLHHRQTHFLASAPEK